MHPRAAEEEPFNQADQGAWSSGRSFDFIAFIQQSHLDATSASSREQTENQADAFPLASYHGPGVVPVGEPMMRLTQRLHDRPIAQHSYQHPHHPQNRFIPPNFEPTQGFAELRHQSSFTNSGPNTATTASTSVYSPTGNIPFIASPYAAATRPSPLSSDLQRVSLPSSFTNSVRHVVSQPSDASLPLQNRPSKRRRVDAFTGHLTAAQHRSESRVQALDAEVYTLNDEFMKDWSKDEVEAFVAASIDAFPQNGQTDEEETITAEGQRLLDIIEAVEEDIPLEASSQPSSLYDRPGTSDPLLDETDADSTHRALPELPNSPASESKKANVKQMRKRGTAPLNSTGNHFLSPKDPSQYKNAGKRRSFVVSTLPAGVTLPKNTPITAKEVCIFFSECLSIAEVTYRMMRNKVKPDVLAAWQLEAVGIADDDQKLKMRLDVIK
ncbi:hypothetical protein AC578_9648 [Pseudocercospora eumusae]|uniref:Uncharacterized protein n=1 Tax=Pseudocercospora eumusae TaxID=321146 RepID=A0A139H193_9PEZI|nr:hypothetical protein AC578_9648 [Pseudocercospora eumusae]